MKSAMKTRPETTGDTIFVHREDTVRDNRNLFSKSRYILSSCHLDSRVAEITMKAAEALPRIDPWRTLGYRSESLEKYLRQDDPNLYRFSVCNSENLAGIVCIRSPWLMGPFIELLAIFPAFQGRGLGGEIVAWLEMEAQLTSKNIWTTVSSFNESAARFYRKRGFFPVGWLRDLIRPGFDETLLRKVL